VTHILNHFSLQAAKWNGSVLIALILIWTGVLACVLSSILAQPFDRKQQVFWIAVVVLLPFLGVLSYLPFSFRKEELPHIFLRKKKRPRKSKTRNSSAES
jgi:hypothetical protein